MSGRITVANKHVLDREYPGWINDPSFVYIGRKRGGMHFGNPFSHRPYSLAEVRVGSVEDAVQCFDAWFHRRKYREVDPERLQWIHDNLHLLQGKTLVCFGCRPCHGYTYQSYWDGARACPRD